MKIIKEEVSCMSYEDYIKEKCSNCKKECNCKIIIKSDGEVECVEDEE